MPTITRENIDQFLDEGMVYVRLHDKWYKIRRNGKTKKWKLDTSRIRIPIKARFRDYGVIDEGDFYEHGILNEGKFRHFDDVPEDRRA